MSLPHVEFGYDPDVDAAYLKLAPGRVAASEEVKPGLIVDLDAEDRIVGVEILRFIRRFGPTKRPVSDGASRRKPAHAAR